MQERAYTEMKHRGRCQGKSRDREIIRDREKERELVGEKSSDRSGIREV